VLPTDLELVVRARFQPRREQLPDARRAERAHLVEPSVAPVEVADDADRAGGRRPDGEGDAADAVHLSGVSPELLVQLFVTALAGQMKVQLAERGQKAGWVG